MDLFFWARKREEYEKEYEKTLSKESLWGKIIASDNECMETATRIILEREAEKKEKK